MGCAGCPRWAAQPFRGVCGVPRLPASRAGSRARGLDLLLFGVGMAAGATAGRGCGAGRMGVPVGAEGGCLRGGRRWRVGALRLCPRVEGGRWGRGREKCLGAWPVSRVLWVLGPRTGPLNVHDSACAPGRASERGRPAAARARAFHALRPLVPTATVWGSTSSSRPPAACGHSTPEPWESELRCAFV